MHIYFSSHWEMVILSSDWYNFWWQYYKSFPKLLRLSLSLFSCTLKHPQFFSYLMLLCKYQSHSGEEKLPCVLFKVKSFVYVNSTRCCLCCLYFSFTLNESHFLLSYSTRIRFLIANLALDLGNKLPSRRQSHWKCSLPPHDPALQI